MLVGYKLIEVETGTAIKEYGGQLGQGIPTPNSIDLPNGDIVYCPEIGTSYSGYTLSEWHVEPPPLVLEEVQANKINEAWMISQQRFAESVVKVMVGGSMRTYGCDAITRENITAINTAISRAPELVPNPRPYTPKGESPIMTTHDEFLAIYLAGLAQGDAFYQAYYAHKTAILELETPEEVLLYNIDSAWPDDQILVSSNTNNNLTE